MPPEGENKLAATIQYSKWVSTVSMKTSDVRIFFLSSYERNLCKNIIKGKMTYILKAVSSSLFWD